MLNSVHPLPKIPLRHGREKVPSLVASAIDFIIFLTGIYVSHSRRHPFLRPTIAWCECDFGVPKAVADLLTKALTTTVRYACQLLVLCVTYSRN
jgi:hypothetical protein